MTEPEDVADAYFGSEVTARDRALFEAGIKLGALYHQAVGFPIRNDPTVIEALQTALEQSFGCQPYVQTIKVTLEGRGKAGPKGHPFDYGELRGDQLNVELVLEYHGVRVAAGIRFAPELQFPLMYVREIQD
ncbi:MAG TPA: dihydroneopterin aldolase family protein [Candidatus Lokiarchaeia archaeon]|nr:dihydroneopterin aldolase family protein [Candidatus Lokiarchaeia archaeon]